MRQKKVDGKVEYMTRSDQKRLSGMIGELSEMILSVRSLFNAGKDPQRAEELEQLTIHLLAAQEAIIRAKSL